MVLVVLPHMINTHRRWSLLVILGSVVLLLAGTGLFLIVRPAARAAAPPASPFSEPPADVLRDAVQSGPTVERLG